MERDQAEAIAKNAAWVAGLSDGGPDYLPRTVEAANAFEPHAWIAQAIIDGVAEVERQRDSANAALGTLEAWVSELCSALGIGEASDIQAIAERVRQADGAINDVARANAQVAELSQQLGEATGALQTADREIAQLKSRLSLEEVRLHEGSAQ